MVELRWTDEAVRWLKEIHTYIARENPKAAVRTVAGIYERAQTLRDHPEMGARYLRRTGSKVRILLHGHYRIAYLSKPDAVDILGVTQGALDIERLL